MSVPKYRADTFRLRVEKKYGTITIVTFCIYAALSPEVLSWSLSQLEILSNVTKVTRTLPLATFKSVFSDMRSCRAMYRGESPDRLMRSASAAGVTALVMRTIYVIKMTSSTPITPMML